MVISNENSHRASPLVMAFVGKLDVNKGDVKARAGLAQLVAQMLGGQYVFVNDAILEQHFPHLPGMTERLAAYIEKNGVPDILLDNGAYYLDQNPASQPVLRVGEINEQWQDKGTGLVPHHLTHEKLAAEKKIFEEHYPHIKRPLIAIMMGGEVGSLEGVAEQLLKIGSTYPEATFFVCPSRRTCNADCTLMENFHEATTNSSRFVSIFNSIAAKLHLSIKIGNQLNIMHVRYGDLLEGYNPYLGLLASADHIVVMGESLSLVSEALYMEKNFYAHNIFYEYEALRNQGYIRDLMALDPTQNFPTKSMEALDITQRVAKEIVGRYNRAISTEPAPVI